MKPSMVLYAWGPNHTTFDTKVILVDDPHRLEAMGFQFDSQRLREVLPRRGTSVLTAVLLTSIELQDLEKLGLTSRRLGDVLLEADKSWSEVGMIFAAIFSGHVEPIKDVKRSRRRSLTKPLFGS